MTKWSCPDFKCIRISDHSTIGQKLNPIKTTVRISDVDCSSSDNDYSSPPNTEPPDIGTVIFRTLFRSGFQMVSAILF
jgi:hypothetical protein